MADELSTKRIINLPAESGPAEGDVFVVDNESAGTKKLPISGLIDSTLSQSGKAADAKAAGDAVDDVNGKLSQIATSENVYDTVPQTDITRVPNKTINSVHTAVDSSGGYSLLYFEVAETADYHIEATTSSQLNLFVYSSSEFTSSTYLRTILRQGNILDGRLSAGEYAVIRAWSTDFTITAQYKVGTNVSIKREQIDQIIAPVFNNGYEKITGTWRRNGYTSYTGTDSRNYRVRIDGTLEYDRDVYLVCAKGFYIFLYFADGTYSDTDCVLKVDANTQFKLTVRRIYEDSSETADIETFANAVNVSTALADIVKNQHTFTDITMFERVGIGGDSYAAGGGIISGVTSLTWGKNLERQAGVTIDIYAKSGESVVSWNSNTAKGLPALLAGAECGLYWLQHGINGTSTPEALGTSADMSASPHPGTFYGQYVEAIEQIKTTFPDARIVLATITGTSYSLNQTIYRAVNEAITAIAEYCSVPLIDITQDDFYKSTWYAQHSSSNHPTAMLCAGMAQANRRLLAKCIMDNPDYFINYGNKYD